MMNVINIWMDFNVM